jgi:hypothetical protein
VIISASRRTDIPAFYGPWFINRLTAGLFQSVNPFNPNQVRVVSLAPENVDAFVFWTKNPAAFTPALDALDEQGYHYYFQYTLNDYPAVLENGLPALEDRLRTFRMLGRRIGSNRVLWRYDPIILSSLTPADYHVRHFRYLAQSLEGVTERVTISFLSYYKKVIQRLKECATTFGILFSGLDEEVDTQVMLDLAGCLAEIAKKHGLTIQSCADVHGLKSAGIEPGACIDGDLIRRVFRVAGDVPRDSGQRHACRCAMSVDMGMYDTCRHGCIYCYANNRRTVTQADRSRHDPEEPALLKRSANGNHES